MMRALVVEYPGSYGIVTRQIPSLKDDQVLVRIKNCSICGSDIDIINGGNETDVVYPVIPGHEWSGEIVKTGVKHKKLLGKRVTGSNIVPCKKCGPCQAEKFQICKAKKELGFNLDGAYAEFIALPGENILLLPDTVDYRRATLMEPLSVGLHALRMVKAANDSKILIIGDGVIGLFIGFLAKHLGFNKLLIAGHHQNRLNLAEEAGGIETVNTRNISLQNAIEGSLGQKADVIFEASGTPAAVSKCMSFLEHGGTLCLVGYYRGHNSAFVLDNIVAREQTIKGSVSYTRSEMEDIVKLLGEGLLNKIDVLTRVFSLDEFQEAFKCVEKQKDNVIKVCFEI